MDFRPGQVVDRYRIEALLGEGGMAVVYRVTHTTLGSAHALKLLTMTAPSVRRRLIEEGRVQASLQHPNIVRVTDVIEVQGAPALVLEFVDGPSLLGLLESARLDLDQIDEIARGILEGVIAAHDLGIVHRDLKPANILLAIQGDRVVPKVADFGLVKHLTTPVDHKTRTGVVMGTPAYMSPEQVRDSKHVDARSDVWALGAILYEIATGAQAFEGEDTIALLSNVKEGRFRPPRELVPELPDRMNSAILAALTVDRDLRIASARRLLAAWTGVDADATPPPAPRRRQNSLGAVARRASLPSTPAPSVKSLNETTDQFAKMTPEPAPNAGSSVTIPESPRVAAGTAPLGDASAGLLPPASPRATDADPEPARYGGILMLGLGGIAAGTAASLLVILGVLALGGPSPLGRPGDAEPGPLQPESTAVAPPSSLSVVPPTPVAVDPPAEHATVTPTTAEPSTVAPMPVEPARVDPVPAVKKPKPAVADPPASGTSSEPAPAPVATPADPPAPAPSRTRVDVSGDHMSAVWLIAKADGTSHKPGDIAPGTYTLRVTFEGSGPANMREVTVGEGEHLQMTCYSALQSCK